MAEKEYIDKEFVINTINELKAKPLPKTIALEHLQQIIEDISADDIVKVVRCKNCKYYRKIYKLCSCRSDKFNVYLNDNDFCSFGERMTDND